MTLAGLAERAGCTDGYLSNVENGVTVPTLSSLATLADVLGTDMSAFFPASKRAPVKVHRAAEMADHIRVAHSGGETYTILSARSVDASYTGLLDLVSPSRANTMYSSSYFGERLMLVLEGEVEMRIGGVIHRLGKGETLHYSSHPDHLRKIVSDEPAEILWIVTPAIL